MSISSIVMLPATEPAARIRSRQVSARAVMAAYLDHIERINPAVNAIVSIRPRDVLLAEADAGVAMDSYHRWMEIVAGPSLAGCPTAAVPAGFGPGGLPSGIQLIGRSQQDIAVLQLAYAYEQVSQPILSVLPPLLS